MRLLLTILLTQLSGSALACMSFGFQFVSGLPDGYALPREGVATADVLLDRTYGRGRWEYASAPLAIQSRELAEIAAIVPVTIGADDAALAGRYRRVRVFVEKDVAVLDATRFSREYLPPVYHVDGENRQAQNHPKALQLHQITRPAFLVTPVSQYDISPKMVPVFRMRLNLAGTRHARVIAAFEPVDARLPVQVVRQQEPTRLHPGCFRTIYVEGAWPQGLKESYRYE